MYSRIHPHDDLKKIFMTNTFFVSPTDSVLTKIQDARTTRKRNATIDSSLQDANEAEFASIAVRRSQRDVLNYNEINNVVKSPAPEQI